MPHGIHQGLLTHAFDEAHLGETHRMGNRTTYQGVFYQSLLGARNWTNPLPPSTGVCLLICYIDESSPYFFASTYEADLDIYRANVFDRLSEQQYAKPSIVNVAVQQDPEDPEDSGGIVPQGGNIPFDLFVAQAHGTRDQPQGTYNFHKQIVDLAVTFGIADGRSVDKLVYIIDVSGSMTQNTIEPGLQFPDPQGRSAFQYAAETYTPDVDIFSFGSERWVAEMEIQYRACMAATGRPIVIP